MCSTTSSKRTPHVFFETAKIAAAHTCCWSDSLCFTSFWGHLFAWLVDIHSTLAWLDKGDLLFSESAHLKLMVGAGSHTKQKSATSAMMTLANTKSSSEEKRSPRLLNSAVPLAAMPIPICTGPLPLIYKAAGVTLALKCLRHSPVALGSESVSPDYS